MRVLYITGSLPPIKCGIGYYSVKLLDALSPSSKPSLLTSSDTALLNDFKKRTLTTSSWGIFSLRLILRKIKDVDADLVSIQYPAKGYGRQLGINLLPYFLKVPVVITLHEYHGSPLLGRIRNLITCLPAKRIVVSNNYDFRSLPHILRKKSVIIPIGSNIPRLSRNNAIRDEALAGSKFNLNKPIGIFFGYAFPNKGLDTLLDALVGSKAQIILATELDKDNKYQANLIQRIEQLRSKGIKVVVTGYLKDEEISCLLQDCDYFVLPQPLPLTPKSGTAIAASIHSLVVVSTGSDSKELSEPFVHNNNSILLNPMNAHTLHDALEQITEGKIQLKSLRNNATKLEDYFDWDTIASKHLELWKNLIRS